MYKGSTVAVLACSVLWAVEMLGRAYMGIIRFHCDLLSSSATYSVLHPASLCPETHSHTG